MIPAASMAPHPHSGSYVPAVRVYAKRHIDTVWAVDRAFEDLTAEDVVTTAGRTIETSDISTFAGLTADPDRLHVDDEYAKSTSFDGRLVHGPLTFSISSGLMFLSGYCGSAVKAMLECRWLKALRPVRPGDTIRMQAEVVELTDYKKPAAGKLTVEYEVLN
jgi:3-hydroxybutyryl-CoA dehydratase